MAGISAVFFTFIVEKPFKDDRQYLAKYRVYSSVHNCIDTNGNPIEINRRLSDAVEGALQAADIPGHYMGVDLRGLDIRVGQFQ